MLISVSLFTALLRYCDFVHVGVSAMLVTVLYTVFLALHCVTANSDKRNLYYCLDTRRLFQNQTPENVFGGE